jgi:prepilin-type processing-associated H-X9-DG protein
MMLPFLEQNGIYSGINFSVNSQGNTPDQNYTARASQINVFLCPSDGNAKNTDGSNGRLNSYLASMGTTEGSPTYNNGIVGPNSSYPSLCSGVFAFNIAYGIRDITDGTSNTICYGEKLVGTPGQNYGAGVGYRGNGVHGAGPVNTAYDVSQIPGNVLTDLANCNRAWLQITPANAGSQLVNNNGQWWLVGSQVFTMFNTIVPPSSNVYKWGHCRNGCTGCGPDASSIINASSNHSGGSNFLMCDGSVRFIKSTISQTIYWYIGTRANNETVSADSY